MEASSPLAALHRPAPVHSWSSRDIFRTHAAHGNGPVVANGLGAMRLREKLQRSSADYFTVKDVRGSSPAASLAADLSQNFRLDADASPEFPTPRRALFTGTTVTATEVRDYTITPLVPSSSPSPLSEVMDLSPLPHKLPFFSQQELKSPTPISTPGTDDMVLDPPAQISRQTSFDLPRPCPLPERKMVTPRRPSLSRAKGFLALNACGRTQSDLLPTTHLGSESKPQDSNGNLTPGECFESASPPQQTRPMSANSFAPGLPLGARARPLLATVNTGSSHSRFASPLAAPSRRPLNPFVRNRKQIRRSLSMFEHPADIMQPKTAESETSAPTNLRCVMDIEEAHEPVLPHFFTEDPSDTIPRISRDTLLEIMDGKYANEYDQKMVIDCRFEYEYDGGHIDGAVNHNNKELLSQQLFRCPMSQRTLLIFHCEYSAHRAPLMARHIRSEDRTANAEHYPRLNYPEVYILDGGYSGFFEHHRDRCFPPEYVEMSDAKHQRTCERELSRLKARKGFGRAQTFAFGQGAKCVSGSPTADAFASSRLDSSPWTTESPIAAERSQARRMASY